MRHRLTGILCGLTLAAAALAPAALGQSRIRDMPGYDQWAQVSPQLADAVKQGAITPEWSADSKSFDYTLDGKRLRFDVKTRAVNEPVGSLATPSTSASAGVSGAAAAPAGGLVLARGRGREADVMSPDGKTRAISRDRNI